MTSLPKLAVSIEPLGDRVVVMPIEAEQVTASGIVIPDTAAEKPDQGEIVAVGKGKKDEQGKLIAHATTTCMIF